MILQLYFDNETVNIFDSLQDGWTSIDTIEGWHTYKDVIIANGILNNYSDFRNVMEELVMDIAGVDFSTFNLLSTEEMMIALEHLPNIIPNATLLTIPGISQEQIDYYLNTFVLTTESVDCNYDDTGNIYVIGRNVKDSLNSIETALNSIGWSEITVNITDADILVLGTNPIELLPAPGVGFYYDIDRMILKYTYNGNGYVIGEDLAIGDGNNNMKIIAEAWLSDTVSQVVIASDISYPSIENTPRTLKTQYGTDPTLNNPLLPGGTIEAIIRYRILTF